MRIGLNFTLTVVLVALIGAYMGLDANPNLPNREFLPNMVRSVPADAFARSEMLPGGQTLQAPPAGTIPRGLFPLPYTASPEDAVRAGQELTNPYSAEDATALGRGGIVYADYCAVCHGASGLGDGPVTLRGVPPPPSYAAEHAMTLTDGQMFHILTYGQKNMASYATQVSREDRWKVILHVRLLQRRAQAQAAPAPPSQPTTPAAPPPSR